MSSGSVPGVSPEEYLEFDRHSEFRHEYSFGEIIPISGGAANHSLIAGNTIYVLISLLLEKPCLVFDSSIRVLLHKGSLYSYADATVVCGKPEYLDDHLDTLVNPKLVVEVLSPSTRNYDLGPKTRRYWQIPSLTDLVLIEQDQVWIEYWSREPGGEWMKKMLVERGDVLRVQSLDCTLPVAEIYKGIEFTE
jgi:Uma2 family endonuclease